MISNRAKGVKRIIEDSGGLYAGTTMRSAYRRIEAHYEVEADRRNLQERIKKRVAELVSNLDKIPLPLPPFKQPVRRIYRMV